MRTQIVTLLLSSQFSHKMATHHFGISSVCQAALFIRTQPRALIWLLFSADLLSHQGNSTQEKNESNSLTPSVYCRILRVVSITKVFLHQHVRQCTDALWFMSFLALHWFRLDVAFVFLNDMWFWLKKVPLIVLPNQCGKFCPIPGSAYMWTNVPTWEVLLSSFWLKHIRGLWVNAAGHSGV